MSSQPTTKPVQVQSFSLRYYAWLSFQLARRDIAVRYRGTSLGWLWALLTPLLMLGVYTFAFKYIFKVRWPGVGDSPVDFALQLFAGLLIFQAAAECWSRSSRIIVEQPHLVKKVVFPLALLPWAPVINALFHAGVSMLLLLVVAGLWGIKPHLQWALLPLVLLPLGLLLWAISLLLATLGVFMRDLAQVVVLIVGLLQFLTPIFFPVSALPPVFQQVIQWNPLTVLIEQVRALVFDAQWPSLQLWVQSLSINLVLAVIAYALFRRVRKGFADVI
jgi:lipopolysaccharide transport system permease protein